MFDCIRRGTRKGKCSEEERKRTTRWKMVLVLCESRCFYWLYRQFSASTYQPNCLLCRTPGSCGHYKWKPARRHSCQRRMMANSYERTMQRETRLWHFCRIKFLFFHVETLEIFVKERWSNNNCKYRTWKIEFTNVAVVMRIHRIGCQINFPLKIIRSRTTCVNNRIKFDRFY